MFLQAIRPRCHRNAVVDLGGERQWSLVSKWFSRSSHPPLCLATAAKRWAWSSAPPAPSLVLCAFPRASQPSALLPAQGWAMCTLQNGSGLGWSGGSYSHPRGLAPGDGQCHPASLFAETRIIPLCLPPPKILRVASEIMNRGGGTGLHSVQKQRHQPGRYSWLSTPITGDVQSPLQGQIARRLCNTGICNI